MQAVISKTKKESESDSMQKSSDFDSELLKLVKPTLRSETLADNSMQINALKEIKTSLIRLQLTKNEVKVYLYLARYGAQKAQKIAEALDLHRTEAYKILRTLENNGVIYRILERPMKFKAVTIEKVIDMKLQERREKIYTLEKKKKELLRLWESLPEVSEPETEEKMLQILEGKHQIIAKISFLLKLSEKKFKGVINDKYLIWLYNSSFFESLEALSNRKDIEAKILTDYSSTSTFVMEEINIGNCDFAFLNIKDQPSFIISDSGYMILFLQNDNNKFGVMETNDKSMVKSYENLFDMLWKNQNRKDRF